MKSDGLAIVFASTFFQVCDMTLQDALVGEQVPAQGAMLDSVIITLV
jgi:hypothetical protein